MPSSKAGISEWDRTARKTIKLSFWHNDKEWGLSFRFPPAIAKRIETYDTKSRSPIRFSSPLFWPEKPYGIANTSLFETRFSDRNLFGLNFSCELLDISNLSETNIHSRPLNLILLYFAQYKRGYAVIPGTPLRTFEIENNTFSNPIWSCSAVVESRMEEFRHMGSRAYSFIPLSKNLALNILVDTHELFDTHDEAYKYIENAATAVVSSLDITTNDQSKNDGWGAFKPGVSFKIEDPLELPKNETEEQTGDFIEIDLLSDREDQYEGYFDETSLFINADWTQFDKTVDLPPSTSIEGEKVLQEIELKAKQMRAYWSTFEL